MDEMAVMKNNKSGSFPNRGKPPLLIYSPSDDFPSPRGWRKLLLGFNLRGTWGFRRSARGGLGGIGLGWGGGLGFAAAAANNQKGHRQNQGGQEVLLHRSNSLKSHRTWPDRTAVATGRAAESTDQTMTKLEQRALNIKQFSKKEAVKSCCFPEDGRLKSSFVHRF